MVQVADVQRALGRGARVRQRVEEDSRVGFLVAGQRRVHDVRQVRPQAGLHQALLDGAVRVAHDDQAQALRLQTGERVGHAGHHAAPQHAGAAVGPKNLSQIGDERVERAPATGGRRRTTARSTPPGTRETDPCPPARRRRTADARRPGGPPPPRAGAPSASVSHATRAPVRRRPTRSQSRSACCRRRGRRCRYPRRGWPELDSWGRWYRN